MLLEDKVKENNLINNGDRIIVGVSGGADSICLLNILANLREEFNLALFVVHVNHCLRQEADFEEQYVREFSEKISVEFYSEKFDISQIAKERKLSTEEAARNVRYEYFYKIADKVGANKIAVAHNLNDNVETILMNLIRGCGIDGLCGIPKENKKIIRPLINVSREEIEEYIKENNLVAMQDKTNFETVYTRNKIRNELIPYLKNINPEVVKSIYKTSELLKLNRELTKKIIDEKYMELKLKGSGVVIDRNKFLELDDGLKKEIIRIAISDFSGNLVNVGMSTIDNAINIILTSQSGAIAKVLKGVNIKISYDKLIFFNEQEKVEFLHEIKIPGVTYIPEINKKIIAKVERVENVPNKYEDNNKCFFDIEKTGEKIYVRNKKEGDIFEPSGMTGKKTLKKFFSDLKIDVTEREKIPIITNDDGIIWVVGFRSSKRFLKDKNTKEVIILEYGENI